MLIRETFATKIEERIEAVVKVVDRTPALVLNELTNLVVTPQWEKHLHRMLDEYTDAFEREDERKIGMWISGFFGSGKSLLMKVLGILLRGGEVAGQNVHQLFLQRLPASSRERADIERFLRVCQSKITTALVGGNLHMRMASGDDPLARIVFRLFAEERRYTQNWAFAWTIEYQIDNRGRTEQFRQRVSALSGMDWEEIIQDSDIYSEDLNQAAAEVLPEHFSSADAVQKAVELAFQNGIAPQTLIERLRRWCESQDQGGRRQKVILQLDELGQWLQSGTNPTQRAMEVQTLVETASSFGQGRIWLVVTAHGDVQALKENVQQEIYAKINQRFDIQCKLSNEDIDKVVRERLLRKTQAAASALRARFQERSGEITDLGTLQGTRRVYRVPKEEDFADFYPYLPWMVDVIPNIVKGIAQAANRNEALTGSNRTMIGVVQGGIIETRDLLQRPVGTLLSLADLYDQLSSDAPVETRTDILRIRDHVQAASEYTELVARALYLLGQDEYIPCTLENITRAMVNTLDANLPNERTRVKAELERLVTHGYVKQVGESYVFLSTQQRTFQDKVRQREHDYYNKNYDLSLKLKAYEKENMLRFDTVPVKGQLGRDKALRIVLDGRVIYNPNDQVTVQVYSPMQYYLDQELSEDTRLRLRSNQEPNSFFFRMGESKALRQALARAVATREVADEVLSSGAGNDHEKKVAQQAKERDLPTYENNVRYELTRAVQDGRVFLRGSDYGLVDGESASDAVRRTLSHFLFSTIYTRYYELPHHISNEATAVKAALNDNTAHADLMALGVYKADGTLNETNVLVSTLKGLLPQAEDDRGTISAQELLQKIEQPPYGWDGNAVKVGLALLLRVSQCRLSENSAYLTDPHSPEVLEALTKAMRFKSLRVQGVRSELKSQELTQARGFMQTVFNVKTSVVPTSINTELGNQLKALNEQAHNLQDWSRTINCPLPQAFSSGQDLVAEMLNIATPGVRIPYFMRSWEAVKQYKELLQELASFRSEHSARYIEMRDFFKSMTNADEVPGAVRSFLSDWRVVRDDSAFTEAARWQDLLTAHSAALQAHDERMAQWTREARQGLDEIAANLPVQAAQAGIPAEHVETEVTALLASLQPLQTELAQPNLGFGETRRLHKAYLETRMSMPGRLREVAARYRPTISPPISQPANAQEIHISWQSMEQTRLASPADLEQFLEKLRIYVNNELVKGNVVILE